MSTNDPDGNQQELLYGNRLDSPHRYELDTPTETQVNNTDGNQLDIVDESQGATAEQNEVHIERFVLCQALKEFFPRMLFRYSLVSGY